MTDQTAARLGELLAKASTHWQVYSEPDVGLPPSLFGNAKGPIEEGFGPIEPLSGCDLELAALMYQSLPALLSERAEMKAEIARLRGAVTVIATKNVDAKAVAAHTLNGSTAWIAMARKDNDNG